MIKAILTSQPTRNHAEFTDVFLNSGIQITLASSGAQAISLLSDASCNLLIADDQLSDITARQLIEKAVTHNPFINCAVISTMSHEAFHEAYEGLGILMQMSRPPEKTDILKLADQIRKISGLIEKSRSQGKETSRL